MNIIIVLTPFQALAAKYVLDSGVLKGETKIFSFLPKLEWIEPLLGNEVKYMHKGNIADGLFAAIRFKNEIKKITEHNETITAIYAHPFHPATNLLMFSPKVSHRIMLPDGIGNYCQRSIDHKLKNKMRIRKHICNLASIPYQMYSGHVLGHDTGLFNGIFAFHGEGLVTNPGIIYPLNVRDQDSKPSKPNKLESSVIFLDQKIESLVPKDTAMALRSEATRHIETLNLDKTYYKGRHDQKNSAHSQLPESAIELQSDLPVELLIQKIRPSHITGFVSSGLIHAKMFLPEIQASAIGARRIEAQMKGHGKGITEALELFGVRLIP